MAFLEYMNFRNKQFWSIITQVWKGNVGLAEPLKNDVAPLQQYTMAEHFKFPPKTMSLFSLLHRQKTFYKILVSTIFDQKMAIMYRSMEEVTPKNDDFLRLRREELWIRRYQSIEFGANKHS